MSILSNLHHWFFPGESNNRRAKILHPSGLAVLTIFLLLFQFGLNWTSKSYPQILGYASQITPQQIIDMSNVKRREQGLGTLRYDAQLSAAAAAKAADMMARDYWAHTSPIGTQPWFFVSQAGYGYRYAGENLARDFNDSASVVTAWVNSPTHRENLFNPKYQDIGVAVVDGTLTGHETTLVVQMFGTKLATQPTPKPQAVGTINVVKAESNVAAAMVEPSVTPVTNPFSLAKIVSLSILLVLVIVLVIDIIEVRRHKIIRWTSKSFAHLLFIIVLIVAIIIVSRGKII